MSGRFPKALALGVFLAFVLGCGSPSGNRLFCAGGLLGSFEGDETGMMAAMVAQDVDQPEIYDLNFTFTIDGVETDSSARWEEDGTITHRTGVRRVSGSISLEDCTASGDWVRTVRTSSTVSNDLTGTWSLTKF